MQYCNMAYAHSLPGQIGVYIVDDGMLDVGVLLQHIEEHGSTANEWFYICDVPSVAKIFWQITKKLGKKNENG